MVKVAEIGKLGNVVSVVKINFGNVNLSLFLFLKIFFINLTDNSHQPWWPSDLRCRIANSRRDHALGPRFESQLGHVILMENPALVA